MKTCSIKNCNNEAKQNNMCSRHSNQIQKYGKILQRTIYDKNEIEILDNYALIHIYNKDCEVVAKAIIDLEDVEKVSEHKWRNGKYISNPKVGYLHRFVTGLKEEHDHINLNRLDNRKCNLRICSHIENTRNRNKTYLNTSGYKGVCFKRRESKYEAYININGKYKTLGYFVNAIDAAKAYNEAAKEFFGEFALLNDI